MRSELNHQNKIVFAGPVGAGKTTAIASISDVPPVATEERASDETREKKASTTVALDYGSIRLENGSTIHLYGTPGQIRFNFMWEVLCQGAIGLVVLIDDSNEAPGEDLAFFLESFSGRFDERQMVIGINKSDPFSRGSLDAYHEVLARKELNVPVLEVDARSSTDIATTLQSLLLNIDPGLQPV